MLLSFHARPTTSPCDYTISLQILYPVKHSLHSRKTFIDLRDKRVSCCKVQDIFLMVVDNKLLTHFWRNSGLTKSSHFLHNECILGAVTQLSTTKNLMFLCTLWHMFVCPCISQARLRFIWPQSTGTWRWWSFSLVWAVHMISRTR